MLFSIIIPTYNYAHFLTRALDSILQQPQKNYEIIVVDDGSTDNTSSLLQTYQKMNASFHYFTQERQGPGKARNFGAQKARGEWLLFLDADDYLADNGLALLTEAIQKNLKVAAILAGHYTISASQSIKYKPPGILSFSREKNFSRFITRKLHFYHGAIILRREIFMSLGGYPENLFHSEDHVLWGRIIANYTFACFSQPVVYICAHPNRLRYATSSRKSEALTYVDLLFDQKYLKDSLLKYKNVAQATGLLELAHAAYRTKAYTEALEFYREAASTSFYSILSLRDLKRYAISRLKLAFE